MSKGEKQLQCMDTGLCLISRTDDCGMIWCWVLIFSTVWFKADGGCSCTPPLSSGIMMSWSGRVERLLHLWPKVTRFFVLHRIHKITHIYNTLFFPGLPVVLDSNSEQQNLWIMLFWMFHLIFLLLYIFHPSLYNELRLLCMQKNKQNKADFIYQSNS